MILPEADLPQKSASVAAFERAAALAAERRFDQALAAADALLARIPDHSQGWGLKAALLVELGRPAEAETSAKTAIALNGGHAPFHATLGNALSRLGRNPEAVECYGRALALDPSSLAVLCNRASVRLQLNDAQGALADAQAALAAAPDLTAAELLAARALAATGRFEDAIVGLNRVLRRQPAHAAALLHRGAARARLKAFQAALADIDQGLALTPTVEGHVQRGLVLLNLRRLKMALAAMEAALALAPRDVSAWLGHAVVLTALARYRGAIASLDQAAEIAPQDPLVRLRRAYGLLRLGDFDAGWADYEHRWRDRTFVAGSSGFVTPELARRMSPDLKRADLAGKNVLLLAEQGIGDQVMFASMIGDLVQDAGAVTCICDARLTRLISGAFPEVRALPLAPQSTQAFDIVLPMGGLGRLYRTSAADFPAAPYLRPRAEVIEAWSQRLGPRRKRLRIGLSWRGGLDTTDGAARSLEPAALAPILALQDAEFVSLQFRPTAAEVDAFAALGQATPRFFPDADIDDLEELAGLAFSLDGVLSVQTALVHLCGAIGAPCQALIPFSAEWRYGAAGTTMPWYGSVELVRQSRPDDWTSVLATVTADLASRAQP